MLEVTVRTGPSRDGEIVYRHSVVFAAANTGAPDAGPSRGEAPKLDCYRDPEFERAPASLAAHNAAYRAWHDADRQGFAALRC